MILALTCKKKRLRFVGLDTMMAIFLAAERPAWLEIYCPYLEIRMDDGNALRHNRRAGKSLCLAQNFNVNFYYSSLAKTLKKESNK
jgi:hypothetical protein